MTCRFKGKPCVEAFRTIKNWDYVRKISRVWKIMNPPSLSIVSSLMPSTAISICTNVASRFAIESGDARFWSGLWETVISRIYFQKVGPKVLFSEWIRIGSIAAANQTHSRFQGVGPIASAISMIRFPIQKVQWIFAVYSFYTENPPHFGARKNALFQGAFVVIGLVQITAELEAINLIDR